MADPQPACRAFIQRRMVEFADTDMAGIAHFSAFFRWMESAEHALIRSLGMSVHTRDPQGVAISFPRVNAQCDYLAPVRSEDTLDIAVTVERLGAKSVTYAFRFEHNGAHIAQGRMTSVCCHIRPGEPPVSTPIPAEMAAGLATYTAPAGG